MMPKICFNSAGNGKNERANPSTKSKTSVTIPTKKGQNRTFGKSAEKPRYVLRARYPPAPPSTENNTNITIPNILSLPVQSFFSGGNTVGLLYHKSKLFSTCRNTFLKKAKCATSYALYPIAFYTQKYAPPKASAFRGAY